MDPIVGTLAKLYLEGALGRVYNYTCVYIFLIHGVVLLTCVCLIIGVEVELPDNSIQVCRAKLLFICADLPAKAALLNCNQDNSQFGCSTYPHEGQQV